MSDDIETCDICMTEFLFRERYGCNYCPKCGQEYCHNEGQQIVLTEQQLELLRANYQETGGAG